MICAPVATAALVGCLLKPSAGSGGGGGGGGGDGGDGGSGSSSSTCSNPMPIDPFTNPPTLFCSGSAFAGGGNLTFYGSGANGATCTWMLPSIGNGALVEVESLATSGAAGFIAIPDLAVVVMGQQEHSIELLASPNAPTFSVEIDHLPSPVTSVAPEPLWLLLAAPDDHTLSARYTTAFDPDLSSWMPLADIPISVGARTFNASVSLELRGAGTQNGSSTVVFGMFDYCPGN